MSENTTPAPPDELDAPHATDDELIRAAREAQAAPYVPGGRFNPPRSMGILGMVLLCVMAGAIYFIYFAASGMERTDKIRLRTLEQQVVDYERQERFLKENGYVPAGPTHKPLTKAEQAELRDLRHRYGRAKVGEPATKPQS